MGAAELAAASHWPPEAVRAEYFTADQQRLAAPGDEFEIVLARQGGSFGLPTDGTIEQVLVDHGIEVDVSCEEGVCGTCVTSGSQGHPGSQELVSDRRREGVEYQ